MLPLVQCPAPINNLFPKPLSETLMKPTEAQRNKQTKEGHESRRERLAGERRDQQEWEEQKKGVMGELRSNYSIYTYENVIIKPIVVYN